MISATVVSCSVYLYNRATPAHTLELPHSPAEEDTEDGEERLLGEMGPGGAKARPVAGTTRATTEARGVTEESASRRARGAGSRPR